MILKALKIMPMVIGSFAVKQPILNTTKNANQPIDDGQINQRVDTYTTKIQHYENSYIYKQYGKTTNPTTTTTDYGKIKSISYFTQTELVDRDNYDETYLYFGRDYGGRPLTIIATKYYDLTAPMQVWEYVKVRITNYFLNTWETQQEEYNLHDITESEVFITSSSEAEQYFDWDINNDPRSIYTWLSNGLATTVNLLNYKEGLRDEIEIDDYIPINQQLGKFNGTQDYYHLQSGQDYYVFFVFQQQVYTNNNTWDEFLQTDLQGGIAGPYIKPYAEANNQWNTINIDWQVYSIYAVQEVIDLPSLMFDVLTMPFTFISIGFNLTLWPNTPYQINLSNLFMSIIAILVFGFIMTKILKLKG